MADLQNYTTKIFHRQVSICVDCYQNSYLIFRTAFIFFRFFSKKRDWYSQRGNNEYDLLYILIQLFFFCDNIDNKNDVAIYFIRSRKEADSILLKSVSMVNTI